MSDCLFCKIIKGDIPSKKVYENDNVYAFEDLNPQAPHHILFIPKHHISTINEATPENAKHFGALFAGVKEYAAEIGVDEPGYRVVMNCNADAGQTVYHVHLHFLAGRSLTWPPG
ncbi:MAG TPA: histidine triad nucleotide-binding protein [Gammaproteobacteria bacterium]|nr:histidine triad nucleotide-binding protein [Gammaproteobacteria bacterium]HBF07346.1 histidine triad nucleotide-binding protein [Gammaproteobacteria bacterium]HCK92058.1 histidine triad nucleotide-binding protein [Gammaproteobacteria bacterium]|tara:strand:+ start:798 stop:1142 length:345 start_codon:yes stop_codon:yes gene_type:complete